MKQMTAQDALTFMNTEVQIAGPGETIINYTIRDWKCSYGHSRFQVEPVSGEGSAWIEEHNIPTIQKARQP